MKSNKIVIALLLTGAVALPTVSDVYAKSSNVVYVNADGDVVKDEKELKKEKEALEEAKARETFVLTFDKAFEKAKENSMDLLGLEETNNYLREIKADLWDAGASFATPRYEYKQWVDDGYHALISGAFDNTNNLEKNKYAKEVQELAIKTTIKNIFTSIKEMENSLDLLKDTIKVQEAAYKQAQLKFEAGVISKNALEESKNALDTNKNSLIQLENNIKQTYLKLNDIIGEPADYMYKIDYSTEFKPYVLNGTIENYVNTRMLGDYNIKIREIAVEEAKFNSNYVTYSNSKAQSLAQEQALKTANRELKTTKTNKEVAIRNAYIGLQQTELAYEQAVLELTQAKNNLKTAEVNFEVGNVTALALDQAKLAVKQKENALVKLSMSYDMQVFSFENTTILQ